MAKKRGGAHGGHGWFVTFADLMGLLMSFFVMLVAFSTQDQQKLQVVAGSMRDAFGVQNSVRYSGLIEISGLPTRPKLKNAEHIPPEEATGNPSPEQHDRDRAAGVRIKKDRNFALAAASLRQALQELPEISEMSRNIVIEETKDGLNIEIVDQDGRAMFAENSKQPFERTRRALVKIASALKALPYRISVTGHSSASKNPRPAAYGPWELSTDRATVVRQILEAEGVPAANFFMVGGKADTQPLFPDDPFVASNRRVTITLMREEPPIPMDFKP